MKRLLFLSALIAVIVGICYATMVPAMLRAHEASDYFVWTRAYWSDMLSRPAGGSTLIAAYLLQFCQNTIIGPAIFGIVTAIGFPLLGGAVMRHLGRESWSTLTLVVAAIMLALYPFKLDIMIQAAFFFGAMWFYVSSKRLLPRAVTVLLVATLGYWFIEFVLIVIWMIAALLAEMYIFKRRFAVAIPVLCLCVAFLMPFLSMVLFDYIPIGQRYLHTPDKETSLLIFVLPFVFILAATQLPPLKLKGWKQGLLPVTGLIICTATLLITFSNPNYSVTNKCFKLSELADKGDWKGVLNNISADDYNTDRIFMLYELLAYAGRGQLGEVLFRYPITSGFDMFYQATHTIEAHEFNRHFYENLGIYDEAFHQAVEGSLITRSGICFGALRNMSRYALLVGDTTLASRYMHVLSLSSNHNGFIKRLKAEKPRLISETLPQPLRSDDFVGAYTFSSEIIRQLEREPGNGMRLQYMLCSLLLTRRIDHFSAVMDAFPLLEGEKLQRAYAEAAAILESQGQSLRPRFTYDPSYDQRFAEFQDAYQKKDAQRLAAYSGSYWTYYYLMAPQEEKSALPGSAAH